MQTVSFNIVSSALQNIEIVDSQVVITRNNGKDYTYEAKDLSMFIEQLQNVILNEESVGRFVNQQIRAENLTQI